MAVTRDEVIAAYRGLLKREPESEDAIAAQMQAAGLAELINAISLSPEFSKPVIQSPFYYYASMFDAEGIMRRHARKDLSPTPGKVTNFLGVLIDPEFYPVALAPLSGQVEPTPIPANWHADIAEWAAALRAVELSGSKFVMAELGCGWGCWMNNTGVAARNAGKVVKLIGIEGDRGHIEFATRACSDNGFDRDQLTLHRGIAAASSGVALFPRQAQAGESWGLEPVFGATEAQRAAAANNKTHDELPMVPLMDLMGGEKRLDLLHIDIQGGEAELIEQCIDFLNSQVAYIVIGTHSREIEGRLATALVSAGWRLEIERPAIVDLHNEGPVTRVDGVQGWRNMTLLPS